MPIHPPKSGFQRLASASVAAALTALCGITAAQSPRMTPGLWEQSVTMKSASGEMEAKLAHAQAQLASLPPDQRAMVEKMMSSRGVQMGPNATTLRMCITKEMADNPSPPHDSRCEQQTLERSGATTRYKLVWAGEAGHPPTTGEGSFTLTGPTSFTGSSVVNTTVQGKPERMETTVIGKYVGADCGGIKPLVSPAH
jgi:hypothetical protein